MKYYYIDYVDAYKYELSHQVLRLDICANTKEEILEKVKAYYDKLGYFKDAKYSLIGRTITIYRDYVVDKYQDVGQIIIGLEGGE